MVSSDRMFGKTVDLSDMNFETEMASSKYTVIDFWNGGCMPCRTMLPIFEELAEKHSTILFGKVNTVNNIVIPRKYNVFSSPTFLFFRDGKKVARILGAKPIEVLEEAIVRYFFSEKVFEPGLYDEIE